ncbi:hypothetical protein C8Q73DRAFT_648107 [Cubamyces lactineus]|nr:hypothetical protein C8Q73DRAFT_648107 [Cubamyces lactineus]
MPIPATLTSYLPVLLVSVTRNAAPDDSSFDTLPAGQVDYLSHNWKEEDVWRSWRSMTRQKNAIANGMRLENASWRTWWKQRNKLKTISPETLNWLKDSDVTWLYGPLHVGHDWTDYSTRKTSKLNASHRKTSTDAVPGPYKTNADVGAGHRSTNAASAPAPKKPILKHRSISQLLSLPASPFFHQPDSDEESEEREGEEQRSTPTRPPLLHTKSDTHINMRGRPFRKNSPPRIIAEDGTAQPDPQGATSSEASGSTGSDQDLSGSSSTGADGSHGPSAKKKHISFNTFVEQCIAIEKPKLKRSTTGPTRDGRVYDAFDDGYDSELGYDGEYEEPVSFYGAGSDSEEDDDDDDVLEMRTSSSRSRSSSSSRGSPFATSFSSDATTPGRPKPPMVRRLSMDREHVTIAPMPPTLLKSTGVGNELSTVSEGKMLESPKEVDLVYVPPASYSLPGTPNFGSSEDVYHHRESYFSVGTSSHYSRSPLSRSPAPGSSPRIPSVGMPSEHSSGVPIIQRSNSGNIYGSQGFVDSPMQIDDIASHHMEDAYDYFGGPDLGEDFSHSRPQVSRRRSRTEVRDDDEHVEEITRYAEGGAASVTMGRSSSGTWYHMPPRSADDPDMPVVVVNEVNGAVEERQERSRETSPSARVPEEGSSSPPAPLPTTPAMPVPRVSTAHSQFASSVSSQHSMPSSTTGSTPCDPALLSPADSVPTRGRTPHSPSVSGSTTTGSSSYSHSTDSRSASSSRGRSSTRTSSFSDRERSGSRSRSRGTSSPMGSISPTGSAIGIGSAYVGGRCRDRDRDREHRSRKRSSEEERGRERTGRRLGDSLSPPSAVGSPSRGSDGGEYAYQPYSPVLSDIPEKPMRIPSPPSSVSGSSTETASVSTVGPSPAQQQAHQQAREAYEHANRTAGASSKTPIMAVAIPSPIPEEEEEQRRSRQPTPANSPVAAFRTQVPDAQKAQPQPTSSTTGPTVSPSTTTTLSSPASPSAESPKSPDSANSSPSRHTSRAQRVSFDGMQEQAGTLVNRAAEIVQSARGFLGSIWNSNSA